MGKLFEYHTLQSKAQFYNCITINTEQEFETAFSHIKANYKDYVFRSVNEARFKLYSSAQRQWIWNDLFKNYHSYEDYINSRIVLVQNHQDIISFFSNNKISLNDFVILALLQHYSQPSPLVDFTYNPLISLFFAFDKVKPGTTGNDIDNYVSLYRLKYTHPCFCSIQDVNVHGVDTLSDILRDSDIPLSQIDTSKVLFDIQNLTYNEYADIEIMLVHGDKMGITNIQIPALGFTCTYNITNPNLRNQEGLFMLNTTEDIPLEDLIRKKHRYVGPLIDCYDINKELEPYIRTTYLDPAGINHSLIYPQDQDSQNLRNWLGSF